MNTEKNQNRTRIPFPSGNREKSSSVVLRKNDKTEAANPTFKPILGASEFRFSAVFSFLTTLLVLFSCNGFGQYPLRPQYSQYPQYPQYPHSYPYPTHSPESAVFAESTFPESVSPELVSPKSVSPKSVSPESVSPESVSPESVQNPSFAGAVQNGSSFVPPNESYENRPLPQHNHYFSDHSQNRSHYSANSERREYSDPREGEQRPNQFDSTARQEIPFAHPSVSSELPSDYSFDHETEETLFLAQNGLFNRSWVRKPQLNLGRLFDRDRSSIPPSERGTQVSYFQWFDPARKRTVPVKIYAPAVSSERKGPFPIIVFSHGLGGSYEQCAYLGGYWATNGYVSVHINHYGSDEAVWKGKLRPLNDLKEVYERNWTGRTRVLDMQFVLDQLAETVRKTTDRSSSVLQWDLNRVGVAGYDLGALASLILAGQVSPEGNVVEPDRRIRAVLAMSPPVQPSSIPLEKIYSRIEIPGLFITGTKDDGIVGTTQAAQRRIPFDRIDCNDQYLVTFSGTDHMIYAGHLFRNPIQNDAPYQNAIARVSTNFWNAYLKEDSVALAFMMSRNMPGLIEGLGRVERKFYLRDNQRDNSSIGAEGGAPITDERQAFPANEPRRSLRPLRLSNTLPIRNLPRIPNYDAAIP